MHAYDVIVVGGGIAGLSAALVLGRCRRRVLVCDHGRPRNATSQGVHAFLSRDGISPWELRRLAREQLTPYSCVELRDLEVTYAHRTADGFEVVLADGRRFRSRKLLLATGIADRLPALPRIEQFYGRTVHHCPICDGWEHRDQKLAVLGSGQPAVELALELLVWSRSVALCTTQTLELSFRQRERLLRHGVRICEEPAVGLRGDNGHLQGLIQRDGGFVECEALFFTPAQEQASTLPERLGCPLTRDLHEVRVAEPFQIPSVPGLFVVGNAAQGLQLAIIAAADGARAAHEINDALALEDFP